MALGRVRSCLHVCDRSPLPWMECLVHRLRRGSQPQDGCRLNLDSVYVKLHVGNYVLSNVPPTSSVIEPCWHIVHEATVLGLASMPADSQQGTVAAGTFISHPIFIQLGGLILLLGLGLFIFRCYLSRCLTSEKGGGVLYAILIQLILLNISYRRPAYFPAFLQLRSCSC